MKTPSFHEEAFPKELFLTAVVTAAIEVISVGRVLPVTSRTNYSWTYQLAQNLITPFYKHNT